MNDSTIKMNICMDALSRTHRWIYRVEDFRERLNQLAIDTLASRGFENTRFYKVRLFNRSDLESVLYASTLSESRAQEYYSHPERRNQAEADSTLRSLQIDKYTSNARLVTLTEARGYVITHDVLYYMVNLYCGRIWCVKVNETALPPEPSLIVDFLNGKVLDWNAKELLSPPAESRFPRIKLTMEMREYLFVDELGIEFLTQNISYPDWARVSSKI